jgi:hypothetical protein
MKTPGFCDEMKTRAYTFENESDNFDENVVLYFVSAVQFTCNLKITLS